MKVVFTQKYGNLSRYKSIFLVSPPVVNCQFLGWLWLKRAHGQQGDIVELGCALLEIAK